MIIFYLSSVCEFLSSLAQDFIEENTGAALPQIRSPNS